jgi:hypothetical protein
MDDITKEELKDLVFVTAHNSGELNEEMMRLIAEFDAPTYRRLLGQRLRSREDADRAGSVGGGTRSAAWLREALLNLDIVLAR